MDVRAKKSALVPTAAQGASSGTFLRVSFAPLRDSNNGCRAVICVYAGFLILHQLVLVPSAW